MAGLIQNKLAELLSNTYEFKILRSKNQQFYWILHNTKGNTEPFAVSEPYTTKQSCLASIQNVKAHAAAASINDTTAGGLLNTFTK